MARKPEKLEDPEQSRRFLEAARGVEDGKPDPTDGPSAFERAIRKLVPERRAKND